MEPKPLPADLRDVLRMFLTPEGDSRRPTPTELDAARSLELPTEVEWDEEVRDAFLAIVRTADGARALASLDSIGVLDRLLPEWRDVRYRPQRDPYHRSTVDVHLLRTLDLASRAMRGEHDEADPLPARKPCELPRLVPLDRRVAGDARRAAVARRDVDALTEWRGKTLPGQGMLARA